MTLREKTAAFLELPRFRNFIIGVIIFNAILLGMETSRTIMAASGTLIKTLDTICLYIFVVEILLKLFAHRWRFFRSGWNLFDFFIVGIALIPAAQSFSVLRALRILRVLRIISATPSLRKVVEGFLKALPGMGSVFLLMSLIFYIGAVMATKLFGSDCTACTADQAAQFQDWFGTLGRSLYSLFQIMTLESWSMGIVRPVLEVYPYAWVFFVPFIMVTTFAVVNLLVGLIVNSMSESASEESNTATDNYRDEVLKRLEAIEQRLPKKD
ncbi:MAG: ion transporter [Pseudomonadota bacterium]